jgi:hypothetical protein
MTLLKRKIYSYSCIWFIAAGALSAPVAFGQSNKKAAKPLPPIVADKNDKLSYTPDSLGNRVPDFSYCGYMASEQPIPNAAVKVVVPVKTGDATLRIQAAINYVASLPVDKNGVRGAVLLQKGTYQLSKSLKINASGVVLRGSGMGNEGTILLAAGKERETFIQIIGGDDRVIAAPAKIVSGYVPVNALKFNVSSAGEFKVGDRVIVRRPSTKAWIDKLGTDHFGGGITSLGWKPGDRDINWDRKIVSVDGNTITIDAPLTTALDSSYGGGTISKYQWSGRIAQTGIENLQCRSAYDMQNAKDEAHRWMAITMENVTDSWIRQVTFKHFAGSAVYLLETANRITVEDCKSLAPVSEIGGQRRNAFWTMGGQTLFQRLYSEYGYHDFAVGFCAPGPTAFVQCQSWQSNSFSGAIDSWASGILFDIVNIDGNALSYMNRGQDAQGAGWAAANSVFWNCTAARIDCYAPPTANNWAFGAWAQFAGDGYWGDSNNSIQPRSLYYAQLSDRLGYDNVKNRAQVLPIETNASSSPTVEAAAALVAKSNVPAPQLTDWIDQSSKREPIPVIQTGIKTIDQVGYKQDALIAPAAKMTVRKGVLVRGDHLLTGDRHEVPWWSGSVRANFIKNAKPALTRWVPGRTGNGLTDDLNEVSKWMASNNIIAIDHNYALWYDRRRDDHERIRRMNGDVWPPFYEVPFARSGQSSGWDGLSKYDLTKYNTWYWDRLKQFADIADQKGQLLIHQNYFQHNIIEAGAHYADFPWRTANNINNTGFPEPPPYAGDKRIFMAEQFYDIDQPARRKLHQAYIRQCLDNFSNNNGVLQSIGAEFTGPKHFVQFWLETIQAWQKEKSKKELISLSTTKDVQDAILAGPAASVVDVIDIRFWHYQADGKTYEPKGGQSLAPRQHARLLKPKATSFEQVYRAVHEYRTKYPAKAVIYSGDSYDRFGWAVLIAGGSLPNLPANTNAQFLSDAAAMRPVDLTATPSNQWALGNAARGFIVYCNTSDKIRLNLPAGGNYLARWINPKDGQLIDGSQQLKAGSAEITVPFAGPVILWVTRS